MMRFGLKKSEIVIIVLFILLMGGCETYMFSGGCSSKHAEYQYQGSQEQKKDLNDIDEYSRKHPGF